MKKLFALLLAIMVLTLSACTNANHSIQANTPNTDTTSTDTSEVQYDYQLKAGETTEVYDITFEKRVTVTLDPASTRDASNEMRSNIFFDNCVFNGGLTIMGDFHAMVSLGGGCSFGENSVVTCMEVTSGVAEETTLDDNLIKVLVGCDGVAVETESAIGVLTEGPKVVFNGTTYSKSELASDAAVLGVYSIYEGSELTYIKLAIGADDSVEFLD